MFIVADVPTVGLYVGWFFGIIGVICFAAGIIFGINARRVNGTDHENFVWLSLSGLGLGVVILIITLLAMWPLKYEYHHYVSKTGTVEKINNRFINNGDKGTSQRFVVKMIGDPAAYSIDDTRASLLTIGARIEIKCKKEHQFFQPYEQNGWACRWGA